MKKTKKYNKLFLIGLFSIVGFILSQISFTKLAGSSLSFSLFDFVAPTAGAFLGGGLGMVSVLAVNLVNFLLHGAVIDTPSVTRVVTNLFGVYYFSLSKEKKSSRIFLLVPIAAMALFWANPVGREAWAYALYWTIPVVAYFVKDNLFLRSLGATLTAHAVGGVMWMWGFNLPATVWKGLIPVVAFERLSFALGISATYIILSYTLKYLEAKKLIPSGLNLKTSTRQIFS